MPNRLVRLTTVVCCAIIMLTSSRLALADDSELQLAVVHLTYTLWALDQGTPPSKPEDLAKFFEINPQESAAFQKVKDGELVVVWSEPRVLKEADSENVVVIHEKAAGESGGLVCFADGSVRRLTADGFRAAVQGQPTETVRMWTDVSGKHRTEAALVDVKDEIVRLRKKNGSLLTLSIRQLSLQDQEYVRTPAPSPRRDSATSVKAAIQEGIGLLEAKQYKHFVVRFMRPHDLKRLLDRPCFSDRTLGTTTGKKDSLEDFIRQEYGPMIASTALQMLKAVAEKQPTFSESEKKATFDLSAIAFPARFRGAKSIAFVRYGSRWCLLDR